MADGQPTFGDVGSAGGATMQPQYMGRTMKCYPVHESEMESLGTLNTEATVFFSVGSACVAFGVGIWTNAMFAEHMTELAKLAAWLVAPMFGVFALVFFGLGIHAALQRRVLWKRIKAEAVTLQATPA